MRSRTTGVDLLHALQNRRLLTTTRNLRFRVTLEVFLEFIKAGHYHQLTRVNTLAMATRFVPFLP